jgi:hypothetical protein
MAESATRGFGAARQGRVRDDEPSDVGGTPLSHGNGSLITGDVSPKLGDCAESVSATMSRTNLDTCSCKQLHLAHYFRLTYHMNMMWEEAAG